MYAVSKVETVRRTASGTLTLEHDGRQVHAYCPQVGESNGMHDFSEEVKDAAMNLRRQHVSTGQPYTIYLTLPSKINEL